MTKGQNTVIIPKQASASYPQRCDNTKLRPVPLNPNQASASYPQHCDNRKLRPVPLNPNQATASYPQHCDNTKLRPVPLMHKIVTIQNSGRASQPLKNTWTSVPCMHVNKAKDS